jgi:hypothetical protein
LVVEVCHTAIRVFVKSSPRREKKVAQCIEEISKEAAGISKPFLNVTMAWVRYRLVHWAVCS